MTRGAAALSSMFLLGLPTLESLRTSSLERHVAAADVGHVQSNALVQLSLGESGGDYSDARAAIVDEGTQNRVGGKECGTYLIVSMQRSASTTLCHDVNLIDGPKSQCAFELFGLSYSRKHNHNQDWVREHPREFVRQRANEFRALRDVCVWGFKLFDRQLADVSQIISEVDKCIIYRCVLGAPSSALFSSLMPALLPTPTGHRPTCGLISWG